MPSGKGGRYRSSSDAFSDPITVDLETVILRIVKEDPFASIWEMKKEVNKVPQISPVSWWQVFSVLRKRGLLTKHSRFKFIRRR